MSAIRTLLIRSSCALLLLSVVMVPGATRADSNGVPPIVGPWSGTLNDVYWDQTSPGSVHPKKRFKSKVDVLITSSATGDVTLTINFQDAFPLNSGATLSQLVLDGFAGNYHVSAAMGAGPSVTLSGIANKMGNRLTFNGVIASTEFTHEVVLKLKLRP